MKRKRGRTANDPLPSLSALTELLTKLRARRDTINEAIEALEMAEKVLAHIEELA